MTISITFPVRHKTIHHLVCKHIEYPSIRILYYRLLLQRTFLLLLLDKPSYGSFCTIYRKLGSPLELRSLA